FAVTWIYLRGLTGAWLSVGSLMGLSLFLLAVWMLAIPGGDGARDGTAGEAATPGRLGYKLNLCGRALWILFLATVLNELFWQLPFWLPDLVSFRFYTIAATIHLIFLWTLLAMVIDACHVYSDWNVRALTVFGGAILFALTPAHEVGRFWKLPP